MTDNVEIKTDDLTAAAGGDTTSGSATEAGAGGGDTVSGASGADLIVERPSDLPESFWDAEAKAPKYADIAARLAKADELETAATAAREGVPADPKDYKFEPAGEPLLGPDGQPAAIDPANPLVGAVAAVAHKHGLPQAAVSDLTRAFIETELAGEKGLQEALAAETAKLGDKAVDRVNAVSGFIKQHCGENADAAIAALGSAGAVQAWETMMTKLTGTAVGALPGAGAQKSAAEAFYPNMTKAA